MKYGITRIEKGEFQDVVEVWEASVRATHHFLTEEDLACFKSLIRNTYLDAVELRGARNEEEKIVGFIGVDGRQLEMLFIHPDYRGKGIGKTLLAYSIAELNVVNVDVNEQNEQAVGFYQHQGFEIRSRSVLDATGKPYPILHLELKR